MPEYAPKVGEIFDGKYELLEVLGSGGVATVFKAKQLDFIRVVALKIVHHEWVQDPEMKARFLQEAILLNKLKHENIVSIYHLAVSSTGLPYIAFELLQGISLKAKLLQNGPLTLEQSTSVCVQVCKALSFAHSEGIIHRDLKPENIVLVDEPTAGFVKVIDFGLAKFTSPENSQTIQKLTQTGLLIGTVNYMSPEQCQGLKVDFRTDIYSLTSSFFEMLTGKPPFDAENSMAVIYQHMKEPVPKIKSLKGGQNLSAVQAFIEKGMAKNPSNRFSSMAEMQFACHSLLTEPSKVARSRFPLALLATTGILAIVGSLLLFQMKCANKPSLVTTQASIKSKRRVHSVQSVEVELNQILSELNDARYTVQRADRRLTKTDAKSFLDRLDNLLKRRIHSSYAQEILFLAYLQKGSLQRDLVEDNSHALDSFQKALHYSQTTAGEDSAESAEPYFELAQVYFDLRQYNQAKDYANRAIKIKGRSENDDPNLKRIPVPPLLSIHYPRMSKGSAYLFLAKVETQEGNFNESLKYLDLALKSTQEGIDHLEPIMIHYSETYRSMGNKQKGVDTLINYEKELLELANARIPNMTSAIDKHLFSDSPLDMANQCARVEVIITHLSHRMYDLEEYKEAKRFAEDQLDLIQRSKVGMARIPELKEWMGEVDKKLRLQDSTSRH